MKLKKIKIFAIIVLIVLVALLFIGNCKKTNAYTIETDFLTYPGDKWFILGFEDISSQTQGGTVSNCIRLLNNYTDDYVFSFNWTPSSTGGTIELYNDMTGNRITSQTYVFGEFIVFCVWQTQANLQGLVLGKSTPSNATGSTTYVFTPWHYGTYDLSTNRVGKVIINSNYISVYPVYQTFNDYSSLSTFMRDSKNPMINNSIINQFNYNNGFTVGYNSGYDTGYDVGYDAGEQVSYQTGYDAGYAEGESVGYNDGYNDGYADGEEGETLFSPAFNVISHIFTAIGSIMAIQLVPHVPLGLFILVPLFFSALGLILWIWRRN